MNLPVFCIKRPAFTIVISLVMAIVGFICFMNLPVRWIPNVNPPMLTISTSYPGANALLVEHDVTKVIEDALSGLNGVETITSTSRQGESNIDINFKLGYNMNAAVEEVRSSLERVRDGLPKDAMNPTVLKADPNSQAILYMSFYDNKLTERELSDYIDKFVAPVFETIDGVGTVGVFGKRVSALRVWLDPAKMAASNVTVDDVTQLLHDQSSSIPSGQIRSRDRFYNVIMNTALQSAQQFNDLIVRNNQNQMVRLKDVGEAILGAEDEDSTFRVNGKNAIALGIIPQSTANPLDVEKKVQKVFAEVKSTLPAGMEASIVFNEADFIRASIHSVYESFFEAVLFVWIVILAFLCSFRATLIPIVTIPVCLISTFALVYVLGFSINTITLMALVLAIGLVVDDAIVMLENISRHIEEGLTPFAAAMKGSKEIVFAVIAMTLTLTAVYAPMAFTSGLLGVLFKEFTFTLAGAVLISGIVALTLSPMMCARLLKKNSESRYSAWLTRKLDYLQQAYAKCLHWILQKRLWVIGFLLSVAMLGAGVYFFLPAELAPAEDMNQLYVAVAAPRSASFDYTDKNVKQLEALYAATPEIESYLSISGMRTASHAFQIIMLKKGSERSRSTDDIIAELTQAANALPGVRVNIFQPPPPLIQFASDEDGGGMGIVMMTSSDYRKLQAASAQLLDGIKQNPGFLYAQNSLRWDGEQFEINIDRDKASDLRVPIANITGTISTLLAGRNIGKMDEANIFVQMKQSALADPNIFNQLYVRNADGKTVLLSSLLNITESSTPEAFKHYARLRADNINLTLAPDFKVADAVNALQALAKENLPMDIKYSFTGEAKNYLESKGKSAFTFVLALIFIYLILVAQFESFIDPLIIMLTVPFAMVGAMLTLKLFGGSLNIYSNIGLITLIGLIAKHGILITDFANRLREEGYTISAAVVEAAKLRLRPILMTTAAMVLGALPLALAMGPGAESRQQIGLVITGGLLFGTLFSLIVVPIVYTYLAPFRKMNQELT